MTNSMEEFIQKLLPDEVEAETWFRNTEVSIAYIALHGSNERVINKVSTTTYKVIDGEALFTINDGKTSGGTNLAIREGEEVTIPLWTPYQDCGEAIMLATSRPPFKKRNEIEAVPSQAHL